MGSCLSWADKVLPIMRKMEVLKIDNTEAKVKGKMVPIWKKYMLTVDEACKLCLNGMPVPLLRNCYSIFNGTKYR